MREKTGAIGAMLENLGQTGVKSLQRIVYSNVGGTGNATVAINPVDTEHCIVLAERVRNDSGSFLSFSYTLSAEKISISHASYTQGGILSIVFTVIELYSVGGQ